MKLFARSREHADTSPTDGVGSADVIRALMIDDDRDDFRIMHDVVGDIPNAGIELAWASSYGEGIAAVRDDRYDIYLVDRRLGGMDGIELVREARAAGCTAPMIMLTSERGRDVDLAAMGAGATDYLVKGRSDAQLVERTIRYAVANARVEEALRRSHRQIAGLEETGRLLMKSGPVPETLERVVDLVAGDFGHPRVALYVLDRGLFRLEASRGYDRPVGELDPEAGRVSHIVAGTPMLVPSLAADPDDRAGDSPMEFVVPLNADGTCHGLLVVAGDDRLSIDGADGRMLMAIGDRVAAALALNRAIRGR